MQTHLSAIDQQFVDLVDEFLARHWPSQQPPYAATQIVRWQQALVEQGWSVPAWPEVYGGPGWRPRELSLWYQRCAQRNIPGLRGWGIHSVAPWLMSYGSAAAQQRYLPAMRSFSERWCHLPAALLEHRLEVTLTACLQPDGGWIVDGTQLWVLHADDADWFACIAQLEGAAAHQLFVVPMRHPAVSWSVLPTVDGQDQWYTVTLRGVELPAEQCIAELPEWQPMLTGQNSEVVAMCQAQLAAVDQQIDDAGLGEDEAVQQRRNTLAVEVAGLAALQERWTDALERGQSPPFEPALLQLKAVQTCRNLDELQVACFGYYALPYLDPLLHHNEGEIGVPGANDHMRAWLQRQVADGRADIEVARKDRLAQGLWSDRS